MKTLKEFLKNEDVIVEAKNEFTGDGFIDLNRVLNKFNKELKSLSDSMKDVFNNPGNTEPTSNSFSKKSEDATIKSINKAFKKIEDLKKEMENIKKATKIK